MVATIRVCLSLATDTARLRREVSPHTEMLASYNKIAIIDDIQFKPLFWSVRPTELRDRIEDSAEWKQLRDIWPTTIRIE